MVSMRYGSKGGTTGGGTSEGGGGSTVTITELWTNPSPTASFSSQTVAVSLAGYDYIGIIAKFSTGNASVTSMQVYPLSLLLNDSMAGRIHAAGGTGQSGVRTFTVSSDLSGVAFAAGTMGSGTANGYILPYKIYGIKL